MRHYESYGLLLPCLLASPAVAQDRFDLPVPFVEAAPVIDGVLDDRAWPAAAVLDGFVETRPGDNLPAADATTVLVAYDALALYVGVRATGDPATVRATLARRDDVLQDDHVRLYLDTFHDRRRAYVLAFNPLGVQQDGLYVEGSDPDYSVDLVMESRGRLTASGYEIEARIPFRSLRYAAGDGRPWGLQVQRSIKHRNDEEDSWRPLVRGRASFLEQAGVLRGLTRIAPERSIELIPTFVTSQAGSRDEAAGRFVDDRVSWHPSLTAHANLSSSLVVDATVNPDFAQVEADELVVTANQRFPIFFEEKRPFFLEGIDLMRTPLQLVDTRRIIDPDFAAKVTGKHGAQSFALLLASDAAPGEVADGPFAGKNAPSAVARLRRDVGAGSNVGLLGTLRRLPDRENGLASMDGRFQLDPGTVVSFQGASTWTRSGVDGPREWGVGYRAQGVRKSRHFTTTLTAEGRSPDYAADLGYTRQTDVMNWTLDTRFDSEPKPKGRLISWSLIHTGFVQNDWDGRAKYAYTYPGLALVLPRQTSVLVRVYADYLRVFEEELGGSFAFSPERETVYTGYYAEVGTTPSRAWSGTVWVTQSWNTYDYDFGAGPKYPRVSPAALADPGAPLDPGPASSFDMQGRVEWKPTDAFRTSLTYTKSRLVRDDTRRTAHEQDLYSLQASRQWGRFAFCRLRADYDSLDSRVRGQVVAGWTPHPGTAVYLGYDDALRRDGFNPLTGAREPGLVRTGRTFFVKLSYLLRRRL